MVSRASGAAFLIVVRIRSRMARTSGENPPMYSSMLCGVCRPVAMMRAGVTLVRTRKRSAWDEDCRVVAPLDDQRPLRQRAQTLQAVRALLQRLGCEATAAGRRANTCPASARAPQA